MSGRPFRGGRRGGFFPRGPFRGRGRGFRENRGRGRGRGGFYKRFDDDRDRDRYGRSDRYYSRSRSRSRTRSRSRSRSYSRSRSRSRSRSKTPRRDSRSRKLPTKKELQEIAAAVTQSIGKEKEKEKQMRSKTPVRTRPAYMDSPPRLVSTRRSLSPPPMRGGGGGRGDMDDDSPPYSRDYSSAREPKAPQHRPREQSPPSREGSYRSQLLEMAMKEKQKLGLDRLDSPRTSSSALKAIQGYSEVRSPDDSDREDNLPKDLYDDLPKPLFPISGKSGADSSRKMGGSKMVSSFTPVEPRKKVIDDIFPDVDEYDPRRETEEEDRREMRGGGGMRSDRYADSRPEQRRTDTHVDLYDDILLDSRASSRSESRFHKEDGGGKNQRQPSTSTFIPGLGIDANIDDEDAFLYGDEAPSAGRPSSSSHQKSFEDKPFMEDIPRKKAPLAEESWMAAPSQRFGGGPPSPDASDLTIDLNLPFDRRKSGEPSRQGKMFQDMKPQRSPEPPQRSSRRMPERMMDEPGFESWKPSQRHRSPSPEPIPPPPSQRPSKMAPSKHSMLGYNSIESMKQELRELKMMLSKEKEAKEESYERSKRMRSPSDDGSYSRGGRSPSPVKRRRESYSPVHRRRGRSPIDSYRRPSPPPSYRRERRESPYYRGAATPSMRRYSPSPTNSLSPASDRSGVKRWSPSPPPRHISRRQEGRTPARTPGRRWSPESPPPRPRRSSMERTPKRSSQAAYYQESSHNAPQPGYYDGGQPPGPPVNLPNLSVPPPNFQMNAPPPQAPPQAPPYFAGYPAQAPPDFSYPPPSTQPQQQQQPLRSNLRVVPLQNATVAASAAAVKEEPPSSSYGAAGIKQEEQHSATPPLSKSQQQPSQEEIEHYLRLVENKDSLRDKVNLLKQELVRLGKIQNEIMRRRQHERDGHRDPLLLESSSMYEDVKKQLMEVNSNMENVSRNIFKVNQKVKLEAINYKKKMEEEALAAESPDTAGIKFVYEDPRDHWCQTCNMVLPSMNDMFRHLHSPKHKEATPTHDRPWAEIEKQPPKQNFHRTIVSTVKGVQFLVGISGYYCKLCKVMSGDSAMARNHLHSLEHNQNYTKYILLNPFYERRWKMEKDLAIGAAIKEEKKRQEKEKQDKEKEKDKDKDKDKSDKVDHDRKDRSRSPRSPPPALDYGSSSSKRSKSSRKEDQEKIRRKNEELLKEERENSRSVKELDDSEVSPKKALKVGSPPPSKSSSGGSGIKLKLLKGQKPQKQPPKQTPVVIIGKAPCFRPSFLSGKSKTAGGTPASTPPKQEDTKPYGPALPPDLATASAAALVEEAKKNEQALEIPLPGSSPNAKAPPTATPPPPPTAPAITAQTSVTAQTPPPAAQAPRKQALKLGMVAKATQHGPLLPGSLSEEDMDLKLLGIERDDIQPIAPVKPPPAASFELPPVQLPNLSVPPPMFPVPPPKRTLLPPPQYLANVPPPTMVALNVPPPSTAVVPLQVLRLPPPPPPAEPEPPPPPTISYAVGVRRPPAPPGRVRMTLLPTPGDVKPPVQAGAAAKPPAEPAVPDTKSTSNGAAASTATTQTVMSAKETPKASEKKASSPPSTAEKSEPTDAAMGVASAGTESASKPVPLPTPDTEKGESAETVLVSKPAPVAEKSELAETGAVADGVTVESGAQECAPSPSPAVEKNEVPVAPEEAVVVTPSATSSVDACISVAGTDKKVEVTPEAEPVEAQSSPSVVVVQHPERAEQPSAQTAVLDRTAEALEMQPEDSRVPETPAASQVEKVKDRTVEAPVTQPEDSRVPEMPAASQVEEVKDRTAEVPVTQQEVSRVPETPAASQVEEVKVPVNESSAKGTAAVSNRDGVVEAQVVPMEVSDITERQVVSLREGERVGSQAKGGGSKKAKASSSSTVKKVQRTQGAVRHFRIQEGVPSQPVYEDVAMLIEESGLNPAILLEPADDKRAPASSGESEVGTPVEDDSSSSSMQIQATDSETVPDSTEGACPQEVKSSAQESTPGIVLGDANAMDAQPDRDLKDNEVTAPLSSEKCGMEEKEAPSSARESDVPPESLLGCDGNQQFFIKQEDTQPVESGESTVPGSQPFFTGTAFLSEGGAATVKTEPISFECQQSIEESGAFESDIKSEEGADFLPGSAGVSTEDNSSAQFVPCDEDTVIEEDSLNNVAHAAAAQDGMADMDSGCMEFGAESEVFGSHADAEVPFVSFGDSVPSAVRAVEDCSVPAVTSLGLDSLLDDCPDWKTAILDATDTLDNSVQGEGLFASASLSAQALADEAAAAAAAAAAMAQAEDKGLCGGGELSVEQLLSDSMSDTQTGRLRGQVLQRRSAERV